MSKPLNIAKNCLKRGWKPIPIPHRTKAPRLPGWQGLSINSKNVTQYFNGKAQNIAVQMGPQSGGLCDVDLDSPEAVQIGSHFLPETDCLFGRKSKPASHCLYALNDPDPVTTIQYKDEDGAMIVELRIGADKGALSVVPGSVHESGEPIKWVKDGEAPVVPCATLKEAVRNTAVAALMLKHWPGDGTHDWSLCFGGFLARAGLDADDIEDMIETVGIESGMGHKKAKDDARTARDAARSHAEGKNSYGFLKLMDLAGEKVANAFCKILNSTDAIILDPADPMATARAFVAAHYMKDGHQTLHRYRGSFCRWTGSKYELVNDETITALIWAFLETAKRRSDKGQMLVPFKPKASQVSEVFQALTAISQLDQNVEAPAWLIGGETLPPAHEFLACANGLLHLPTAKLHAPTPKFFNLTASEVSFDPKAPKPQQYFKFVDQLLGDDTQSVALLQDYLGYLLSADTSHQKILLVVGPKRSGKGTIGRVVRELLGTASVGGPTMSSLSEPFGLEPLITKSLATISDARIGSRTDKSAIVERLLSISGEDALSVPRKFKTAWEGQLKIRFMILTNELPALADGSGALANRFVVLLLVNSFFGKEDQALTKKLLTELPGILNWALEGYRRLRLRGHFVMPRRSIEAVAEIEALGSPVKGFIDECCKVGAGFEVKVDDLWNVYTKHSAAEGRHDFGSREWFGRNLRSAVPGITVKKPRRKGERERMYVGIMLNKNNNNNFIKASNLEPRR